MQQKHDQEDNILDKIKNTAAIVTGLAHLLTVPIEMLLHWRVGKRYPGLSATFAVPVILLFGLFGGNSSTWPLFLFLMAFLVRCSIHRVVYLSRSLRGIREIEHTRRPGIPLVMRLRPQWNVVKVYWLEPPAVFVSGFFLSMVTRPLGFYLMAAGVGWFFSLVMRRKYMETLAEDGRDAVLEAQFNADRLREMPR